MNFEHVYSDPPRIRAELAVPAAAQHRQQTLPEKPLPRVEQPEQAVASSPEPKQPPEQVPAKPVGFT